MRVMAESCVYMCLRGRVVSMMTPDKDVKLCCTGCA